MTWIKNHTVLRAAELKYPHLKQKKGRCMCPHLHPQPCTVSQQAQTCKIQCLAQGHYENWTWGIGILNQWNSLLLLSCWLQKDIAHSVSSRKLDVLPELGDFCVAFLTFNSLFCLTFLHFWCDAPYFTENKYFFVLSIKWKKENYWWAKV